MSELKDKGYNEKRYLPDTKVIQIDPLGAALDKACLLYTSPSPRDS